MFKKSNLLFITSFIIVIILIGLFNYCINPYNINFSRSKNLYLFEYKKELVETILNLSRNSKYKNIVLGSSTTHGFFHKNILSNTTSIYMLLNQFDITTQMEYLDYILTIHPEIETIIFPVEYAFFGVNDIDRTPQINQKKRTINTISRLLFSRETTIKSIKKTTLFISNFPNSLKELKTQGSIANETIEQNIFGGSNEISSFVQRNYSDCIPKPFLKSKYEALKRLKEISINKNKEIIFIFPPYHALAQAYLYKTNKNSEIENIKKYVVENFPTSKIIDYAFINSITSEPIENTPNYRDIIHPIGEPGFIFYCTLKYPAEFKDKNLYVELSKENINSTLKWQKNRLEQYLIQNSQYINNFIDLSLSYANKNSIKTVSMPENCKYYLDKY